MDEFDWSITEEVAQQIDQAMEILEGPALIAAQIPDTSYCVTQHSPELSREDTVFMAASALAGQVRTVEERDELAALFTDIFIRLADSTIEAVSQTAEEE